MTHEPPSPFQKAGRIVQQRTQEEPDVHVGPARINLSIPVSLRLNDDNLYHITFPGPPSYLIIFKIVEGQILIKALGLIHV